MSLFGAILSTTDMDINTSNTETAGTTVTIDLANGAKVRTWTAAQNATVNLTGTQQVGRELLLIIGNDATLPRVITLGTGFISPGIITGVVSKKSVAHYVSDGTNFYEIARTVGI